MCAVMKKSVLEHGLPAPDRIDSTVDEGSMFAWSCLNGKLSAAHAEALYHLSKTASGPGFHVQLSPML